MRREGWEEGGEDEEGGVGGRKEEGMRGIGSEEKGGAWCPSQAISKEVYEYLQIDLGSLKVITKVETQGRFGNGLGQEYAKHFLLEYQREDSGQWIRFRNRESSEVFLGNENTYLAELRSVSPPIIAKRVRFIPYSQHTRTVCMRVEMYGCDWTDGTVSYDMPQGHRRGAEVDLYDFTYDGLVEDSYLTGGLGQLTDWDYGDTNFRLDTKKMGVKGYEWVGWKNDTSRQKPVTILLKFDTIRNFSQVKIHSNNHYSKDVRVFRRAEIFFSVGGKYYQSQPLNFNYQQDSYFENARQVVIRLANRVARYIRVDLYFESRWIMISEVEFESVIAEGNYSVETAPPTTPTPPFASQDKNKSRNNNNNNKDGTAVQFDINNLNSRGTPDRDGPGPASRHDSSATSNLDVGGPRGRNSGAGRIGKDGVKVKIDMSDADQSTDTMHTERENKNADDYVAIIIGGLAALIVLLIFIIVVFFIRQKRRKLAKNRRTLKPVTDSHVTINLNDLRASTNGKVSNGNPYNSVATEDADSLKGSRGGSGCDVKLGKNAYLLISPKGSVKAYTIIIIITTTSIIIITIIPIVTITIVIIIIIIIVITIVIVIVIIIIIIIIVTITIVNIIIIIITIIVVTITIVIIIIITIIIIIITIVIIIIIIIIS
ncbi:hypothetical protein ACOMHN_012513 [Nucella lapillus]